MNLLDRAKGVSLTIFLAIYSFGISNAQDFDWFSTGSTWTYVYQPVFGPDLYQSVLSITEQTQLNGIDCSKMETETSGDGVLFECMPFAPAFYFLQRNDSVFFASDMHPYFRLGIDFNAEVGQHWFILVDGLNGLDSIHAEVIAREQVVIEGNNLVQLSINLSNANPDEGILEFQNPVIAIEKIGAINFFFMPFGKYAACDVTTSEQLQCFSSDGFQYVAPGFASCTVGLGSIAHSSNELRLYPNPTSTMLTLHLPGHALTHATLQDMQGREVLSVPLSPGEPLVDVRHLPKGMYLLRATETGGGVFMRKLVVE